MRNKFFNKVYVKGSIASILVFMLIIGIFIFHFMSTSSEKDKTYVDISKEEYEGFLNDPVVALGVISMLKNKELALSQGESRDLRNQNFAIKVKRGKDFQIGENTYMSFLIETHDDKNPQLLNQFVAVGLPDASGNYGFHIVLMRKKTTRG